MFNLCGLNIVFEDVRMSRTQSAEIVGSGDVFVIGLLEFSSVSIPNRIVIRFGDVKG